MSDSPSRSPHPEGSAQRTTDTGEAGDSRSPQSPVRWGRFVAVLTGAAGLVTVLAFVTGADNLCELFGCGPHPAPVGDSAPSPSQADNDTEQPVATPTETLLDGIDGRDRKPVRGRAARTYPLGLTVGPITQDGRIILVSVAVSAKGNETLYYLHGVQTEAATTPWELDRFVLTGAGGEVLQNTGQRGIPELTHRNDRLYCLPVIPGSPSTFFLEFDGVDVTRSSTLTHTHDPNMFTYKECPAGVNVALPDFAIRNN